MSRTGDIHAFYRQRGNAVQQAQEYSDRLRSNAPPLVDRNAEPSMAPAYAPPPWIDDGQVGARRELPTCQNLDPAIRDVRVYANGNRDKLWTIACYGAERIFDPKLFEFVFVREAIRLWGAPWEKSDPVGAEVWLDEKTSNILYLLENDPLGLFNKKVAGDETNWVNLAAFANFYWWLDDSDRKELDGDIESGNASWAEFVIDWARPRTPVEVLQDPAYSSTGALLAQNYNVDVDELRGKGFAQGTWPIELPSGIPVSIPGLPPVCTPFPSCALSAFPMAMEAMWKLVESFAAANPGVTQVRGKDGLFYRPSAPPTDVATDEDIQELEPAQKSSPTWAWVVLGVGFAILGSMVVFSPSKGIVVK